jgi:pyruvate kinase
MPHVQVIAKLEDLEGLVGHAEILAAADAMLFSRGSLGTCMEPEKVRKESRAGYLRCVRM